MKSKPNFMNKAKLVIPFSVLLLGFLPSSIAQDIIFQHQDKSFSISLEAGYSCNLVGGDAKQGIKDMIDEFENTENENINLKGKTNPKLSPFFGAFLDYQLKESLSLRGGIRLNTRGYNVRIKGEEKDEEYQFDHRFEYNENYRLTTFEVPLSASYAPNNKISFNGGFLVGFALNSSSKMKVSFKQEVIINGEVSDDLSEGTTIEEFSLTGSPNNPFLGVFAGVDYEVYSNLFLCASIQKIGSYAQLDYGKVSDTSILLALRYFLPRF